jgi:cyclophilin family peptidyl-prolyl cis-trans isomerase
MTRRALSMLALAGLAAAGCPAPAAGPQMVLSSSPPGVAAATASPAATPAAAATATPFPIPSVSKRPLGPAPEGGSLADVAREAGGPVKDQYRITVETTQGDFVMTLFPEKAVKASAKFLQLAKDGHYDGTSFHRVIQGFVAQGGDHLSKELPAGDPRIGTGTFGEAVPDDFGNGLKHLPGAVAFAHSSAPNSSYSQFYVCQQRLRTLDGGYTVFGQVLAGFDTIGRLALSEKNGVPTGAAPDRIIRMTVKE